MRHMILLSFLGLSLAACGKEDSSQDIQQVDQSLANDNLIDNDLTAIDAITGSDAGMAADVDPSTWRNDDSAILEGGSSNSSGGTSNRPQRPAQPRPSGDDKPEAASAPTAPKPEAGSGNSSADGN